MKTGKKYRIGFIGNFIPPFSTENDRKWSFEKLGHQVIPFQENQTTSQQLLEAMPSLDMLVYSHTHDPSYIIANLVDVFGEYRKHHIPTVSVHLDRWAWLARVRDVGNEATWFTQYIFMADASPEAVDLYERYELNWRYLRPGVIERDCYIAPPNKQKYPHDIIFVGSRGYHPEYEFRAELVDFLKKTYGNRFGTYGNDGIMVARGHDLNTLYASSKIAVGDSCFGGRPNYVSDRYYETRGRGGFLLHPRNDGVDSYGVGHYDKGNLQSLRYMIDYYLQHDDEREAKRKEGFEHVKAHETYTNRSKEMLKIIFGEQNEKR